jgi:hypothetical protein
MASRRTAFLLVALAVLFVVNALMAYGIRNHPMTAERFLDLLARREGFAGYSLENAGPAKGGPAIGPFDDLRLLPANGESQWRGPPPNEPLNAAAAPSDLFIFSQNQCRPDCCPSSYSCGGGCVCTTIKQRQFLASRGGNRSYDDGV